MILNCRVLCSSTKRDNVSGCRDISQHTRSGRITWKRLQVHEFWATDIGHFTSLAWIDGFRELHWYWTINVNQQLCGEQTLPLCLLCLGL
jgi:hypothetical protein